MRHWIHRTMFLLAVMPCASRAVAGDPDAKKTDAPDPFKPRVKFETTLGDFVVELDSRRAPITVWNFVKYVEDGFYEGTIFHRVKRDFVIQGGGLTPNMKRKTDGLRPGIKNEWPNGLSNVAGTIAMARRMRDPNSARSQFYINVVDNPGLDRDVGGGGGYCVFGKVIDGMDTIEKIKNTPVGPDPSDPRKAEVVPVKPVVIKSARLISEFDQSKCEAALAMMKKLEEQAHAAEAERVAKWHEWVDEIKAKAVKTESGLMYYDLRQGDGGSPKPENKVRVHMTGWLSDGTVFADTRDSGSEEVLVNKMVKGWQEGVIPMKVGGRRVLIVPPELGFGSQSVKKVPANSTLVYDVDLLEVVE